MKKYICIHGHFYQPPRENPWLEDIELQDSAHPFHDWNERIAAECYGPNAQARILDERGRIANILNNYARISFNFGPTLLSWLEKCDPQTYEAIQRADRLSAERFHGHGSALAQVYNHQIMPLANPRDRETQVVWGLEDFRRRFGREPEGMWLPETAVDTETLEILARHGLKFTLLAPDQAARVRPVQSDADPPPSWKSVLGGRIDPTTPYLCRLPSGASIALFFYDGPISHDLAFGDMLKSGAAFQQRLMAAFAAEGRPWPQLVHIATDGETYGHHHNWGEMALSYCLGLIEDAAGVELINYGLYLERHPPVFEVEILERTAWSCAHGVERWRSDCGCRIGSEGSQAWRAPLRDAMNWLSAEAARIFTDQGSGYLREPWQARSRYIEVLLDRSEANVDRFLAAQGRRTLDEAEQVTVLKLLEMQRFAQMIFTSCGWFFDDIAGTEAVQVLQYAARCLQLAEELSGVSLEQEFLQRLEQAPSSVLVSGAEVYLRHAKPAQIDLQRMAAHYAISSLFENYPEQIRIYAARIRSELRHSWSSGRAMLVTGQATLCSQVTRESLAFQYAVLHPGDHNLTCGLAPAGDSAAFQAMESALKRVFQRGDLTETIRQIDKQFDHHTYSIWHLFRDEQRQVMGKILTPAFTRALGAYRQVYENNSTILNFLDWLQIPLPAVLLDAACHVLNAELQTLFGQPQLDLQQLEQLIATAQKWQLKLDYDLLGYQAEGWLNATLRQFAADPSDEKTLERLIETLETLQGLPAIPVNSWTAQNIFFQTSLRLLFPPAAADPEPPYGPGWQKNLRRLGELLQVKVG
jgi:alpha-amylase/alpha-mannosidase (GH57 family)